MTEDEMRALLDVLAWDSTVVHPFRWCFEEEVAMVSPVELHFVRAQMQPVATFGGAS